jgi:hypothetical protein
MRSLGTTWITRPRTPISDHHVTAATEDECGISRAHLTNARSSEYCGPWRRGRPGHRRIVVNRASGSSRDVLTPIRRWISRASRDRIGPSSRGDPVGTSSGIGRPVAAAAAPARAAPARGSSDPAGRGGILAWAAGSASGAAA